MHIYVDYQLDVDLIGLIESWKFARQSPVHPTFACRQLDSNTCTSFPLSASSVTILVGILVHDNLVSDFPTHYKGEYRPPGQLMGLTQLRGGALPSKPHSWLWSAILQLEEEEIGAHLATHSGRCIQTAFVMFPAPHLQQSRMTPCGRIELGET